MLIMFPQSFGHAGSGTRAPVKPMTGAKLALAASMGGAAPPRLSMGERDGRYPGYRADRVLVAARREYDQLLTCPALLLLPHGRAESLLPCPWPVAVDLTLGHLL